MLCSTPMLFWRVSPLNYIAVPWITLLALPEKHDQSLTQSQAIQLLHFSNNSSKKEMPHKLKSTSIQIWLKRIGSVSKFYQLWFKFCSARKEDILSICVRIKPYFDCSVYYRVICDIALITWRNVSAANTNISGPSDILICIISFAIQYNTKINININTRKYQ